MQVIETSQEPEATPVPIPEDAIQTEDGFIVDPASGEILGLVIPELAETDNRDQVAFAEQIMKRMQFAASKAASCDNRLAPIVDSINAKLDAVLKEFETDPEVISLRARAGLIEKQRLEAARRYHYLESTHGEAIKQAAQLKTTPKNRTWINDWGLVKLRKVPTNVEVLDPTRAVLLCKDLGWDAAIVVKESIAKSEFKARVLGVFPAVEADPFDGEAREALNKLTESGGVYAIVPEHDKAEIFTGVPKPL